MSVSDLHEQAAKISSLIDHHRTQTTRLQGEYNSLLLRILQDNTSSLSPSLQTHNFPVQTVETHPKTTLTPEPKTTAKEKPAKETSTPVKKPKKEAGTPPKTANPAGARPPEPVIIPTPRRRFLTPQRTAAIIKAVAPYGRFGLKVHQIASHIGDAENLITLWYNNTGKTIPGIFKPKSGIIAYLSPDGIIPPFPTPPETPEPTVYSGASSLEESSPSEVTTEQTGNSPTETPEPETDTLHFRTLPPQQSADQNSFSEDDSSKENHQHHDEAAGPFSEEHRQEEHGEHFSQ